MSDQPAYRLTEPEQPAGFSYETDATMSAREMEAHTERALDQLRILGTNVDPRDGGYAAVAAHAQAHATLALAWATRLAASHP